MNLSPAFRQLLLRCCFVFTFVCALDVLALGQDLHYSQFYLNPLHLSPAATGIFKGDLRVAGLYRSQWKNVPVAYETFSGAVDWKAIARQNNLLSVGFLLQNDQAGDAGLSWLQVGATLGVAHALNENHTISLGFGWAFLQRSVDVSGLKFKNQWGGDVFNPNLPTGESFNRSSAVAPSLSTGLQWHYAQSETRSQIDIGGGIAHLNEPVVSLGDFDEKLSRRISFFSSAFWQINSRHDLVFITEWQQMTKAKELLFGAGIRRILSSGLANETVLQMTLTHRLGDAIIPAIQLERNNWTLGMSYDWNTSAFETATRGRGGIEIAVIWRKIPAPVFKNVKSCPVM